MPFDFNKIKSIFVVDDPSAAAKDAPVANKQDSKSAPPSKPSRTAAPEMENLEPGQVSSKFVEVLFRAMENANLPGVDYLEYRQSLKSLEKMPMEEQVRYQSAFAMAQAMGATPPKLIESAQHYIDVLKGESAKFDQALRNQLQQQVGNREEAAKNLDAVIQQKAAQIKKLTEEIAQHQKEAETLRKETAEASQKMGATKNNFTASYDALVSQILSDVENMKKFLK
ncbi:MAG: hypothetical protein R2830_06120 [Saprospiraceae bacterium]